jgi:hypothetical protein
MAKRLLLRGFGRSSSGVSGRSGSVSSRGGSVGGRSSGIGRGGSSGVSGRGGSGVDGRSSGFSSRGFRFLLGAAGNGKGRNGSGESNVQFHVGTPKYLVVSEPNKRLLRDSHRGARFYRFPETFETSAVLTEIFVRGWRQGGR